VTTTIARFSTDLDARTDVHGAAHDIDYRFEPNRSTTLLLMNEALARVRMLAASRRERSGAQRPAREVAMLAAKRRERL